jgi:hypothetical protein
MTGVRGAHIGSSAPASTLGLRCYRELILAVCPSPGPLFAEASSCPLMPLVSRSEYDPLSLAGSLRSLTVPSFPCDPSSKFLTLQRSQKWTATNTRVASPGYATPPGFLSLSTFYSVHNPSGLVSCRSRSWASSLRGFPSPIAARTSHRRLAAAASRPARPFVSSLRVVLSFRRSRASHDRDSKGLRIRRVRSTWAGVIRWPRAGPLSDFPLRGLFPSTLAPCFHGASSHGLRHSA